MKTFKMIDLWLDISLFVVLLVWNIIAPGFETVLSTYCIMGAYQVISMLIHEFNSCFITRTSKRRVYHWIALGSLVFIPFGLAYIMMVAAPLMAAYYIMLCHEEVYVKMKRPLALLK